MNLNKELLRMQELAGITPSKHAFEVLLEEKSHLTINEIINQLNEVDDTTEEKAANYWEGLSDKEQKEAGQLAQKIPPAALNLTKDEFGDKVANLAPNSEIVKTPRWKRIVIGALALIISSNSLQGPIVTAFKNDNNVKKFEMQAKQAQSKLDKANTADFNDYNDIERATNLNPSLDDPGDGNDALHIKYKTSGYAIKDKQRQDTKQFADNIIDIIDDGNDVEINATSTYSHQPDDPDNENKAVDGKQLDKARANSFKAVIKEDIKQAAAKKGYQVSEEGDTLKIKTPKGVKTVKITSDVAKEVGKPNKTGDVDQGTIVSTKVLPGTPEKAEAIWQTFVRDEGLPKMPGDKTPSQGGESPKPGSETDKPSGGGKAEERPTSVGDATPEMVNFAKKSNLNRNQEIFTALKMMNPDIKGDPTDRTYKSWYPTTKKIVILLRKSPDLLLNKVKQVTGVEIPKRAKSTGPFKRSGVAENLMLESLLNEAAVDNYLNTIGITDAAIKKNQAEVIAYLMSIYNLGIADVPTLKNLPKDVQKQIADLVGEVDDKLTKSKSPDVTQIGKDIESNTSLKTALSKINTYDEFEALVLGMAAMVNPNFAKQKQDIRSALSNLSNKIKQMKEESETPSDTQGVYKIIETLKLLKTHLNNINSRDEFEQLIFALLPHIDPKGDITKDKNRLASAIMSASTRNALKDPKPIDLNKLGK